MTIAGSIIWFFLVLWHHVGEIISKVAFLFLFACVFTRYFVNTQTVNHILRCFFLQLINCLSDPQSFLIKRILNFTAHFYFKRCSVVLKKLFTKGQLISKCLFGVFNSPKKRTKTIRPEVHIIVVEFFCWVFQETKI